MRGLWTPVRLAIMRSPKLRELARQLNCDRDSALGAAVRWFGFVTEQCNSACTHLTEPELEEELARPGLVSALKAVGWAHTTAQGVVFVTDYGKHSCSRVLSAARVADFRARQEQDCNGNVTPNVTLPPLHTRQDKTRQENPNTSAAYPENVEDVVRALAETEGGAALASDSDSRRCAKDFLDTMQACGWQDSRGRTIRQWVPFLDKFSRGWQRTEQGRAAAPQGNPRNARTMNAGRNDTYNLSKQ